MGFGNVGTGGLPFPFNVMPYFFMVVIPLFFIFLIFRVATTARTLRKRGVSVVAPEADLLGRLAQSDLMAPAVPIEERLARLDALLAAGTITQAEHQAARLKLLTD